MCMNLYWSFKVHNTKADRTKRRTRKIYSYIWRFQHSSVSNSYNKEPKIIKDIDDLNHVVK